MERDSKGHMDETLNLRCFYLRLIKKIWLLPVATILGAALALLIYYLATVVYGPGRTYKAEAKLYISFAYNENTGTLVDWYNAFTWNQLMSTDDILNPIIDNLEKDGIKVVENDAEAKALGKDVYLYRDELIASINADIPSDVRLMVFTVSHRSKGIADEIITAATASLEKYGVDNSAFDSIKLLSSDKAKLVVYSDRSVVAGAFGAILGLIFSILFLLLQSVIDDAVYVPEDAEKRYGQNVLGVLFSDKKNENEGLFRNELIASFSKYVSEGMNVAVISTDAVKNNETSVSDSKSLEKCVGEKYIFDPISVPGNVLENYRKIRTCDGVVVCVPYGKRNGAMTEHVIAQLKKHDCVVLGVILSRADRKFMNRYYGIK